MVIIEIYYSAVIIMTLRIMDVSLGTLRTILVIQSRKYAAGTVGFIEVLIWIFAMRYIVEHMDNTINLIGYAAGFGLGTILGVAIEQKIGIGHVQVNIISQKCTDLIASTLRSNNHGVTILPGEGINGEVSIVSTIINKKGLYKLKEIVNGIDPKVFMNVQPAMPSRGFIHGARK